jgi:hypothetical protein
MTTKYVWACNNGECDDFREVVSEPGGEGELNCERCDHPMNKLREADMKKTTPTTYTQTTCAKAHQGVKEVGIIVCQRFYVVPGAAERTEVRYREKGEVSAAYHSPLEVQDGKGWTPLRHSRPV